MFTKIFKSKTNPINKPEAENSSATNIFAKVVKDTETGINQYAQPMRENILKRYPTVFSLLVTVGAIATFLGLEQILLKIELFIEQPWLLFLLGIGILTFTGRLYKKLS